jgi:hypothetical protein
MGEEGFVHPRGRRKSVQEKQVRCFWIASLAVEDRKPVHNNGFVRRRNRGDIPQSTTSEPVRGLAERVAFRVGVDRRRHHGKDLAGEVVAVDVVESVTASR